MTCIEKRIEYELVPLDRGSEEHGRLHPFRRIPILEIDGEMMPETLAITGHLDEAFAGPSLQPDGHAARARMRIWMGVCSDYLFRDVVRTLPRGRAPTDEELTTAATALAQAEGLMEGGAFLAGEELTLADLYLAPQIANCGEKAPALLDHLAAITAWAGRVGERESFKLTRPDAAG